MHGKCFDLEDSYECRCDYGFAGVNCDTEIQVVVPQFRNGSYLVVQRDLNFLRGVYTIRLKTNASFGMIFFTSEREDGMGDFMAVTLKDGFVEFSFNTGGDTVMARSDVRINNGSYHTVLFSRRNRLGSIRVDGGNTIIDSVSCCGNAVNLNRPAVIYLGGIPDSVTEIETGLPGNSLVGTILEVELDGRDVDFVNDVESGFDVQNDPEANPCRLQPCENGGTCETVGSSVTDFICTCTSGFTGETCQTKFDHCTEESPCRHGGTCSNIDTLPGFKCSCPYGFGGSSCEEFVGIIAPEFFGDSYVDYIITGFEKELENDFVLEFDLHVGQAGQTAFITFLSDFSSVIRDYFAVGLREGKLEVQMNLGEGVSEATARTNLEIDQWLHIFINRSEEEARLYVNGVLTIELFVPGDFKSLNVRDHLYVGGVPPVLYSFASNQTEFSSGLIGCVDNITLTSSATSENILSDDKLDGANVGSCFAHPCEAEPCDNGGTCVPDGANFHCSCPPGVFGNLCDDTVDPCAASPCADGATCVINSGGFRCVCTLLQAGPFCSDVVNAGDVRRFDDDDGSFMNLNMPDASDVRLKSDFTVRVRPETLTGLIIYMANKEPGDFIVLGIRNGIVEFRYDLGSGVGIIRSATNMTLNTWHTITATRNGKDGSLQVDGGEVVTGSSRGSFNFLDVELPFYVGGLNDFSVIHAEAGFHSSFTGCIEEVIVNSVAIDFMNGTGNAGLCQPPDPCANVTCLNGGSCMADLAEISFACECPIAFTGEFCESSFDACSLALCKNGGTCVSLWPDFICDCPKEYRGEFCEVQRHLCDEKINGSSIHMCANDSYCGYDPDAHEYYCSCPLGKLGEFCDKDVTGPSAGRFHGFSYVEFDGPSDSRNTNISITFNTTESNGMLAYLPPTTRDFMVLGIIDGKIELQYDLGQSVIVVSTTVRVDDGLVHKVSIYRNGKDANVTVDDIMFQSPPSGTFFTQLDTTHNLLFGGIVDPGRDLFRYADVLSGRYSQGMVGCIYEMTIQDVDRVILPLGDDLAIGGKDVTLCS